MRRYETIIIIDPDLSAEKREPVLERVKDVIAQQGGYLAFIDDWGTRKLAYEIKKKERGLLPSIRLLRNRGRWSTKSSGFFELMIVF